MSFYVHKYEVELAYGGSEEGGWWYDRGTPANDPDEQGNAVYIAGPFSDEESANSDARTRNEREAIRAKEEEAYEYTSVLSYRSTHYSYGVSENPIAYPYPVHRPHYE